MMIAQWGVAVPTEIPPLPPSARTSSLV
uniref:Uncharacterized protein n=1 Tax=Anguilla anguilla TaxID=7936 RepID=A0A0E9UJN1_ANGAN